MDLEQSARGVAQKVNARYRSMRMSGNTRPDLYSVILLEEVKLAGFRTAEEISFMRSKVAKAAAEFRNARRKRAS